MKRIVIILFCFICCFSTSIVYAKTLYPVNVWEGEQNGRKELIKTYELSEKESAENIPTESFELLGWRYDLVDIVKNENASTEVKQESQVFELETKTKDYETILKLLPSTIEYEKKDGYTGLLQLDAESIKIETMGIKKSSDVITEKRNYSNLSTNDINLIPKFITINGEKLTLSGVTWHSKDKTVDSIEIPSSYTATVTYSKIAYKTTVTGYLVKATYLGTVSRISKENILYTAHFIGTEIPLEPSIEPLEPSIIPIQQNAEFIIELKDIIIFLFIGAFVVVGFLYRKQKRKGV